MAVANVVEALRQNLGSLLEFEEKEMVNRPGWGEMNFESHRAEIEMVLAVARDLLALPTEKLPTVTVGEIDQYVQVLVQVFREFDGFSLTQGDPATRRQQLTQQLEKQSTTLMLSIGPWLPYLADRRDDVSGRLEQLHALESEFKNAIERTQEAARERQGELARIIESAQQAAGTAGVGTFNQEFLREADRLTTAARVWLGVTVVGAGVTAWTAWYFAASESPTTATAIAGLLLTKLSLVAVMATATIWCGRMYRSLMHQIAVNRHRALSLQTFQAFVNNARDQKTKDAVLLSTTSSIFDNVPTGMIDQRGATKDPAIQFVEIGKAADKVADPD